MKVVCGSDGALPCRQVVACRRHARRPIGRRRGRDVTAPSTNQRRAPSAGARPSQFPLS